MRTACVVVADPKLQAVARQWATAGLLADSYWIDQTKVPDGLSLTQFQQLVAMKLPGRMDVQWQRKLAGINHLNELVFAWVRRDDENHSIAMHSAAEFLRQAINPEIQLKLFDIVVPTELQQFKLPDSPPGWRQMLVSPEDRMDLDAPDAGWSANEDAVIMHCVAAVIGRLGGCHQSLPEPPAHGLEIVTCVSRHVFGGKRARRQAERYVDHELPRSTAREVAPTQHELFRDQWEEIDRAANWLLARSGGAFEHAPSTPVNPPEVPAHVIAGMEMPFGVNGPAWRRALGEFISGEDPDEQAHTVNDPTAPYKHPRFLEPSLVSWLQDELVRDSKDPGAIPDPGAWRDFVDLATSLSDGGDPPNGYAPVNVHGRRAVVLPEYVGPSSADFGDAWTDEQRQALPELEYQPVKVVGVQAVAAASQALGHVSPAVATDARGRAIGGLARSLNVRSPEIVDEQLKTLAPFRADAESTPLPFVERMQAKILGEQIHARLDAQRLHELAVDQWPEPRWQSKRVRAGSGLLAALASTISIVWLLWGPQINQWLSQRGWGPWADWRVYAVSGLLLAISLIGGYVLTLRIIMERDTYWRWRLNARLGLAAEAKRCYGDNSRLGNATRIMGLWYWILAGVLPKRDAEDDLLDELPQMPLPVGLACGLPELHAPYARIVTAGAAAQPGFRKKILERVATRILDLYGDIQQVGALGALTGDTGYTEGALHRVSRDLPNGAWQEWRHHAVTAIAEHVKLRLGAPTTPVSGFNVPTIAEVDAETQGKGKFTPGFGYVPKGSMDYSVTTHRWSSNPEPESAAVQLTDELIFTSGAVVVRFESDAARHQAPQAHGESDISEDVLVEEQ